jgi:hypothetical protein
MTIKRWKSVALRGARAVTAGLVHHRHPALSPDGRWLAFATGEGHDSAWVLTDRRGRVCRAFEGPAVGGCAFAATGSLAFGRLVSGLSEIWMSPGRGIPAVRLLGGDGHDYTDPAFSPDGNTLCCATRAERRAPARLILVELDTGNRRSLPLEEGRSFTRPAFSPGGEVIYCEGEKGEDVGIFAVDPLRGAADRVTFSGVPSRRPAPLGATLVVVERPVSNEPTRLVLVDAVGLRERVLAPDADEPHDHREPAATVARGKVRLAYTVLLPDGDAPPRREVCVARLRGVSIGAADEDAPHQAAGAVEEGEEPDELDEDGDDDAEEEEKEEGPAAAPAAGARA